MAAHLHNYWYGTKMDGSYVAHENVTFTIAVKPEMEQYRNLVRQMALRRMPYSEFRSMRGENYWAVTR